MMRRRRLTMLVAGGLILLGSSLSLDPVGAADAATIDDRGWWWKLQTNPDLLVPPPPGVAEGQLLVQGAPDGATAVAAVAASLPDGEANPVLTLAVAEGGDTGGDQAVVLACQAGSQWNGGSAKPWAEKPQPACDAGGVQGIRSADGSSWSFDLTAMQFSDRVNVVLVPGVVEGQPAGANGSSFSLTFAAPSPASIVTTPGEPPLPPALVDDIGSYDTTGGYGSSSGDGAFTVPSTASGGGFSLSPVTPALPAEEQGLTPVAPVVQDRNPMLPASTAADPRSPHAQSVGVILLLLGGAVVHLAVRQQPQVSPEGVPGGLGQWSRPRWGTPPALRG